MSNKNVKIVQVDKQLENMSKSLKQLSSNLYADNFALAESVFILSSFVHKMLVSYNMNKLHDQEIIYNELRSAYDAIKDLVGPTN